MRLLHRAGGPWVDLGPQLVAEISREKAVMWVSFSGTVQIFATVEDAPTRTRQGSRGSPHLGDGWTLLLEDPFFATACGCGDGTGFRSTPPLLVATIDTAADVARLFEDAKRWARRLADSGHDIDAVPTGHPKHPCGAMYCPRILPESALPDE